MVSVFRKFVLGFDLAQLDALIGSAKVALQYVSPEYRSIAEKHLQLASEHYDEAITALRYSNLEQTESVIRNGLMHAYFGYRLARPKVLSDKNTGATQEDRRTEAQEKIATLGTTLIELKAAIEFSNSIVSDIAHQQVEKTTNLYDAALDELKNNQHLIAKRCAQAGLLQLSFATELIRCDNGGTLWGLEGLANPLTNCPLRKLNQLAATIVQIYALAVPGPKETATRMQVHLRKAMQSLNDAIKALSKDNLVYAQALVVIGLNEIYAAQALIQPDIGDAVLIEQKETNQLRQKFSPANLELQVMGIKDILQRSSDRVSDKARNSLERLLKHYQGALRALDAGNHSEAQSLTVEALDDVAQARKILYNSEGVLLVPLTID